MPHTLSLRDLPMPIRTPRLIIIPPAPGMGQAFHDAKMESLSSVKEWFSWAHKSLSPDDDEKTMRKQAAKFMTREDLMVMMFDLSGKLIGSAGWHDMGVELPVRQIGYWCRSSETGKGYITETVNALTRYGFDVLGLKKICIKSDSENTRSLAVPKRLGFELDYTSKWGTSKPGTDEMRILTVYSRYDTDGLPPLDISW